MRQVACAEPKTRSATFAKSTRAWFSYDACRPGLEKALAHVCRPEVLSRWLAP
jgi:hypothetical protein